MHNGVCVPDSTFFQAEEIRFEANGLQCLLASSEIAVSSAQVKWLYPDGNLVDCSKIVAIQNDIGCSNAPNNNGAVLYTSTLVNDWPSLYNGVYTCCLPGNCFDGSTNSITVQIFGQSSLYNNRSYFPFALTFLFENSIPPGVEAITDLYATSPQDVTAVPQNYTVHCLINETCDCAAMNSPFGYYMFMEGSLNEQAVQYCNEVSSLSCSEEFDSNDATAIDNQLTVTWYANTVITQGDYSYHTISTPANGDHDFLCVTNYTAKGMGEMKSEAVFVSIKGIDMLLHA